MLVSVIWEQARCVKLRQILPRIDKIWNLASKKLEGCTLQKGYCATTGFFQNAYAVNLDFDDITGF